MNLQAHEKNLGFLILEGEMRIFLNVCIWSAPAAKCKDEPLCFLHLAPGGLCINLNNKER